MSCDKFEALIVSSSFERLLKEMQEFFTSIMSVLAETMSDGEAMTVEGDAPEVVMVVEEVAPNIASVKVLAEVPKSLRLPRLRPMPTKEGSKMKKYKQKVTPPVRMSPRKHL